MDPYDNNVTLVPAPKPGLSRKTIFIGIGIVVAIIITLVALLASRQGDNLQPLEQRLALRMTNLQGLASSAQESINNEDLADLNSQLSALTTSNNANLQKDLKSAGISDKYPKEMVTSEANTTLYTSLKQATVNGDFDQQYVTAATKKITDTSNLMNTIYQKTQNAQLRQDISKTYKDLQFVKKQMLSLKLN